MTERGRPSGPSREHGRAPGPAPSPYAPATDPYAPAAPAPRPPASQPSPSPYPPAPAARQPAPSPYAPTPSPYAAAPSPYAPARTAPARPAPARPTGPIGPIAPDGTPDGTPDGRRDTGRDTRTDAPLRRPRRSRPGQEPDPEPDTGLLPRTDPDAGPATRRSAARDASARDASARDASARDTSARDTRRASRRSEPDRRRRRPSRKKLAAGAAASVAGLAGAGYLYSRPDGTTELPATLDRGLSAGPGQVVDDGAGGGATSVPAASLHVPAGLSAEHLLDRVTYGATDALRTEVARQGAAAWLAGQLAPGHLPDPDGDAVAALFPRLSLSAADAARSAGDPATLHDELAAAHLGRAVWSRRQLLEIMVDLWSNHFSVPCPAAKAPYTRHRLDADILRKGALGSFEALLRGCTLHPATLAHLDSATSAGDRPNENHARELLEIHTVGTASGFTEHDVQQTALLLTGFEVRDGVPRYVPDRHHVGKVTILGFTHANGSSDGGVGAVEQFLSYLASHPATATNLARTLAVRFVADSPPEALVRRLAQVYLAQRTAIVPVLAALFTSPEFAASAGAKTRRPLERIAATIRTLGLGPGKDPAALKDLLLMADAAGHRPLASADPGGYPDVASAWQSPGVALAEFNAVAQLVHGWWPRTLPNPGPAKLLRAQPSTRAAAIEAVGRRVLGRPPTAVEREAASKLLATSKLPAKLAAGSWEQKETVGLIATLLLCSPAATHR